MLYKRRSTPLHAAGPGAQVAWTASLGVAALVASGAVELGVVTLTVLAGSAAAQCWHEVRRALKWALVLAATVCLINALVSEQGTTVLWHFGTLPLVGFRYVTAQAIGDGAVLGLRAATLVLIGALYSVAVDPDSVLTLSRRFSFRSALTATIATRMVPLLLRDSQRLADAQRTRSGPPPARGALVAAATSGMLDRALDVAATLEVRGFGLPGAGGATPRLRTRHDVNFMAAGAAVLTAIVGARVLPWLVAVLPVAGLGPFLDRRGVG